MKYEHEEGILSKRNERHKNEILQTLSCPGSSCMIFTCSSSSIKRFEDKIIGATSNKCIKQNIN